MENIEELEKELLTNGWTQQWFDDKSGYWFVKNIHFRYLKPLKSPYHPILG